MRPLPRRMPGPLPKVARRGASLSSLMHFAFPHAARSRHPMIFRFLLFAALLLIARRASRRRNRRPRMPVLRRSWSSTSPKGRANSCGPGCDRWIAVEGKVDQGAAARIRRFLRDVKDTQRPIYLHSPGGSVGAVLCDRAPAAQPEGCRPGRAHDRGRLRRGNADRRSLPEDQDRRRRSRS